MIGLENSRHSLNQSDAKLKPIATSSLAFSRASSSLLGLPLSPHWLAKMSISVLIDRCDNLSFGFFKKKLRFSLFFMHSFRLMARSQSQETPSFCIAL